MISRRAVLRLPLGLLASPVATWARGAVPTLVARYSDSSRRGRPFAKDPCVLWFRDRYWMYYSLPPYEDERRTQGWGIGIATSGDCRQWTKAGEMAAAAPYEAAGFCAPGAVVIREKLHLFYQTYGLQRSDAVCHAVSTDGLTFERNPSNPVLRARGDWNCGRAIDAEPFVDGERLLVYAATRDPGFRRQMVFGAEAPLGSPFRSEDFRQLADRPLLAPELPWERDCIEAPTLIRRDGTLYMFYAGGYNNEPQQIGCAASPDGVNWTRLSERPLLANGAPGAWNASESGHPGVVGLRDGRTFLFFQGNPDGGKTWELAAIELEWRSGRPVPK